MSSQSPAISTPILDSPSDEGAGDQPGATSSPGRVWVVATVVAIAVTLLVLAPICSHEFLWWDDQGTIHQNPWMNPPTLRSFEHFLTTPQWGLYMPVTTSAWALIACIAQVRPDEFGIALNPWFFHAASLAGHLIAVALVIRIFRMLNATPFAACCGALIFAVHPVQVEAVAWASGLKDVLAGLFGFASILQYIHFAVAREQRTPWVARLVAATIFFQLAMLSKASAMTLPLAIVAIDRWAIGRPWRDILPTAAGLLVLAFPIACYALIVQDAQNTATISVLLKPLVACDSLAFYALKLILPIHLGVDYGRTPSVVISHGWLWWDWVVPVGIGALLWLGRKRTPVLLAAGAIFVIGCLPTLGLTRTLYQFYSTTADHYLYPSMLGPALAVAWLLSNCSAVAVRGLCVVALCACAAVSFRQQGFWMNDQLLFDHCVAVNPNSYVGYGNLGSSLARSGDTEKAVQIFRHAVSINPEYALSYSNLGHALAEEGDIGGAIAADQQSIRLQKKYASLRPSWKRDNEQVGDLLVKENKFAEAVDYFFAAAQQDPNDARLLEKLVDAQQHALVTTRPATSTTQ